MFPHLISYPVFRLVFAWMLGILLADRFIVRQEDLCLLGGFFLCGLLSAIILYAFNSYRNRWCFGVVALFSFGLGGGISLCIKKSSIYFDWQDTPQVYVGRLCEEPEKKRKTWGALVDVEAVRDSLSGTWLPVGRIVKLYGVYDSLQGIPSCGSRLAFYTKINASERLGTLPGFDYGHYLERQGISGSGVVFSGAWRKASEGVKLTFRQYAKKCRGKIVKIYESWGMEAEVLAVVSALTVGDKEGLTPELRNVYSVAGASHILALSGLHVGVLTMLLTGLLYPLRLCKGGWWMVDVVLVLLLWCFAFLSGLSPSVVRAVTMFSIYVLVRLVGGGTFSGACTWSLTCLLMLAYNPLYLFDLGFQLSFTAVFAILFFYPLMVHMWNPSHKLICYIWKAIALSVCVQCATLPFVLHYFGHFPTYFILANLVVTPLASAILFLAVLSLCGMLLFPVVGVWIVFALSLVTRLMTGIMKGVHLLAGAQLTDIYLSEVQSWMLGVAMLCLVGYGYRSRFRLLALGLFCLLVLLGVSVCERFFPPPFSVCFSQSQVSICTARKQYPLVLSRGIGKVNNLGIAVLSRPWWREVKSRRPMPLRYAYLCRGFYGSLQELFAVFQVETLILDESLSSEMRMKLKKEACLCGVACVDLSGIGYYSVPL